MSTTVSEQPSRHLSSRRGRCHQVRLAAGLRLVGRLVDQYEVEVVLPLDAQHVIDQSVDQSAFAGPSSSYYQNGPLATTDKKGRVARLAENV